MLKNNLKKTLFISDLHLDPSQPHITQQFFQLLNDCDQSVDALYILGDLFEAWIGDDDNAPFHQEIIRALKAATDKGLSIYFIRGNRDFLIGKKFQQDTGCIVLPDEEKINVYGTPVVLMHGDTLCTQDVAYLKARKIAYNPFLQRLFLWLPLSWRQRVAERMRVKSDKHKKAITMQIMDVTEEEVRRVMRKHQVSYLVHGHTHRPAMHEIFINGKPGTRIVLAAWHGHGNVLVWDEAGEREFVNLG